MADRDDRVDELGRRLAAVSKQVEGWFSEPTAVTILIRNPRAPWRHVLFSGSSPDEIRAALDDLARDGQHQRVPRG